MERSLYGGARKKSLALDCDLSFIPLPLKSGDDDLGNPIVTMEQWPFVLPDQFAPGIYYWCCVVST